MTLISNNSSFMTATAEKLPQEAYLRNRKVAGEFLHTVSQGVDYQNLSVIDPKWYEELSENKTILQAVGFGALPSVAGLTALMSLAAAESSVSLIMGGVLVGSVAITAGIRKFFTSKLNAARKVEAKHIERIFLTQVGEGKLDTSNKNFWENVADVSLRNVNGYPRSHVSYLSKVQPKNSSSRLNEYTIEYAKDLCKYKVTYSNAIQLALAPESKKLPLNTLKSWHKSIPLAKLKSEIEVQNLLVSVETKIAKASKMSLPVEAHHVITRAMETSQSASKTYLDFNEYASSKAEKDAAKSLVLSTLHTLDTQLDSVLDDEKQRLLNELESQKLFIDMTAGK